MNKVAIVDYGSSNLHSVNKALLHVAKPRQQVYISDDPEQILAADRVVIPGQGAMRQCITSIHANGLDEVLRECLRNKPFLGICMGLQTLMQESEEDGGTHGLGIVPGNVVRFPAGVTDSRGAALKIPHMGWNIVQPSIQHPLWSGLESGQRFYFVHSYYVCPADRSDVAATTEYAVEFTSAIARDNLFAVQFHPEKSQSAGLKLLENFLNWQ